MIRSIEILRISTGSVNFPEGKEEHEYSPYLCPEEDICLNFEFADGRQIQVYARDNGLCISAVCGGRLVIEPGAQNTMQVSAVLP